MKRLQLISLVLVFTMLFSACKQQSKPDVIIDAGTPVNSYKTQFYKIPDGFIMNYENTYRQNIIHYRDGLIKILGKDSNGKSVFLVYDPILDASYTEPLISENIEFLEYCSDDSIVTVDSDMTLNKISADGETLFSLDLSEQTLKLLIGKDDTIYIGSEHSLTTFTSDGKLPQTISLGNYQFWNVEMLENGDVFVVSFDDESDRFQHQYINGSEVELSTGINYFSGIALHGGNGYDMYYQTPDTLSGYNITTKEMTPLMNWISADLNTTELLSIEIISPELIITTSRSNISNGISLGISTLIEDTPEAKEHLAYDGETIEINLAVLTWYSRMLLPIVTEFNKTNGKYRINVESYVVGENPDYTRFNAELASGKIPDLMFGDSIPMRNYINKGMIADLYEFMDNDPDLSRDKFLECVLYAGEDKWSGKLYQLPLQFGLYAFYGKKSNLGDIDGWTYDEFQTFRESLPDDVKLTHNLRRDQLLREFTVNDVKHFVDYEKGTCNFENPEFINAMEVITAFDKTTVTETIPQNEFEEYIAGLYNLYKTNKLYMGDILTISTQDFIGSLIQFDFEPVSFPGFPTITGENGTVIFPINFVMTEQSKVKDGVWEFIKYALSDEIQLTPGLNFYFPVTKSALRQDYDTIIKSYATNADLCYVDEKTGLIGYSETPLTDEERLKNGYAELNIPDNLFDTIVDMLSKVKSKSLRDTTLAEIITEEINNYWEGRGTLEETAKIIQNRASIYMSEVN